MSINISTLHDTTKLVESSDGQSLTSLDKETVIDLCAKSGTLLFRGFSGDIDTFSQFVENNSSKVTLDPARSFHAENAQKVDAGLNAVGLHCENGNAPKLPHFIWFYCKKAAKIGSQTTFCDGKRVWAALPDEIKAEFESKKIKYSRNVPENLWRAYIAYEMPNIKSPEDVTVDHLKQFSDSLDGQIFKLNDDMSLHYSFIVGAVHKTLFSDDLSFSNSILGPSFNYEKPTITFEDDSFISEKTIDKIKEITEKETQEITWQDGDVVMIDNTRFMHGRREIKDTDREIYAALSYL
jgi:alpha-ketoglutarate-dependent taurine dioxygenase